MGICWRCGRPAAHDLATCQFCGAKLRLTPGLEVRDASGGAGDGHPRGAPTDSTDTAPAGAEKPGADGNESAEAVGAARVGEPTAGGATATESSTAGASSDLGDDAHRRRVRVRRRRKRSLLSRIRSATLIQPQQIVAFLIVCAIVVVLALAIAQLGGR